MGLPVRGVLRCQFRAADHQQVLGVAGFRCLREIEAAGYDRGPVDHHDLVVGNRVLGVDEGRNARVQHEIRRRILFASLALVQNDLNLDAAFVGIDQGLGDWNADVKLYAWTRIVALAAAISLTTASVQPPFGEK